ncbi:MAG: hypothetical protein IJ629_06110 [Clostridia bacterium]|nr:hypothetical protein [Clostridia bacterium]
MAKREKKNKKNKKIEKFYNRKIARNICRLIIKMDSVRRPNKAMHFYWSDLKEGRIRI